MFLVSRSFCRVFSNLLSFSWFRYLWVDRLLRLVRFREVVGSGYFLFVGSLVIVRVFVFWKFLFFVMKFYVLLGYNLRLFGVYVDFGVKGRDFVF